VPGVRGPDFRVPFARTRRVFNQVSNPCRRAPERREIDTVRANDAAPLRLRRLPDAVQEYLPKRGSVPEVREGLGEGAEPIEPETQIPATHGGAAGG
jgi:hypothetical protein